MVTLIIFSVLILIILLIIINRSIRSSCDRESAILERHEQCLQGITGKIFELNYEIKHAKEQLVCIRHIIEAKTDIRAADVVPELIEKRRGAKQRLEEISNEKSYPILVAEAKAKTFTQFHKDHKDMTYQQWLDLRSVTA